jgi:hypothetical protein
MALDSKSTKPASYRAFTADKKPNEDVKVTAGFECHKPLASQDFVHAYDKLKDAARQGKKMTRMRAGSDLSK